MMIAYGLLAIKSVKAKSRCTTPFFTYERTRVGKSEVVAEMPPIRNTAYRLVRFLNHLDQEPPFVLVGHLLGGWTCVALPITIRSC